MTTFIADKKRIIEVVQPMKILLRWWCQLEAANTPQALVVIHYQLHPVLRNTISA